MENNTLNLNEAEKMREYRRSVLKERGKKIVENFAYRCENLPSYKKKGITFMTKSGPISGCKNEFNPVFTFEGAIKQICGDKSFREELKIDDEAKFVVITNKQYGNLEEQMNLIENADKNDYSLQIKIWHGIGLDKLEITGDNNSPYLISKFDKEDAEKIAKSCKEAYENVPPYYSVITKTGEVIFSEKDIQIENDEIKIVNDELVDLLNEWEEADIEEPTKFLLSSKNFINQVKAFLDKDSRYKKLAEEKIKEQERLVKVLENNVHSLEELGNIEAAKQCLEDKKQAEETLEMFRKNPEGLKKKLRELDLAQKNGELELSSNKEL